MLVLRRTYSRLTPDYSFPLSLLYLLVVVDQVRSEHARGACTALRLLPISGGIFGGELADTPARMAAITVDGLVGGWAMLTAGEQEQLRSHPAALHMCVFMEAEMPAFADAWAQYQVAAAV